MTSGFVYYHNKDVIKHNLGEECLIDSKDINNSTMETILSALRCNSYKNKNGLYFNNLHYYDKMIQSDIKYYKEIVDSNKKALVKTLVMDITVNYSALSTYDTQVLEDIDVIQTESNTQLIYNMISSLCNTDYIKSSVYFKHTHKLYYELWLIYEDELYNSTVMRQLKS
jgi:hypothetical protein